MSNIKLIPKIPAILIADYERRFIWFDVRESLNSSLAAGFVKLLKKLDGLSDKPITIYIRGVGGDFYAFMRMAHVIEDIKSNVAFVSFDLVRSGCFWITQFGNEHYALNGTRFTFHRAAESLNKGKKMSQEEYLRGFSRLKLIDGMQLWFFTRRGTPISEIIRLLEMDATITVDDALRLKLVSGTYDNANFNIDKELVQKLVAAKYGPNITV